jgi:hypothetical protein
VLFKPREVERALGAARAVVGIARNVQREARARLGIENAESLSSAQLLERYFASRSTPPDRADELMQLANAIIGG